MTPSASGFVIVFNKNCPLYAMGDEFELKGRSLFLQGKPACLTLMDDIMQTIESHMSPLKSKGKPDSSETFACSGQWTGCSGSIRLRYHRKTGRSKTALKKIEEEIEAISGKLSNFSIFKSLSEPDIKEIVSFFRIKQFSKDEIVLKKGDPGVKLYILLSGQVEVLGDYDVNIAMLGKGEIFGEMSLLSGNPVNSTIKVIEDAKIMFMNGNHFRMMLNRFPSLQMYFARLLVDRLAKSNEERSMQLASGMAGNFSEISPAELFQTLNMTEKTGVLNLYLADGSARISFRNGDIISAGYNKITGKEAFFEIVKQVRGNFKFEPDLPKEEKEAPVLGDFMFLLIEGLNRLDEESFRAGCR
jgi:CRP/FNR family cyclic AMP-dependent transcriptional regulator